MKPWHSLMLAIVVIWHNSAICCSLFSLFQVFFPFISVFYFHCLPLQNANIKLLWLWLFLRNCIQFNKLPVFASIYLIWTRKYVIHQLLGSQEIIYVFRCFVIIVFVTLVIAPSSIKTIVLLIVHISLSMYLTIVTWVNCWFSVGWLRAAFWEKEMHDTHEIECELVFGSND